MQNPFKLRDVTASRITSIPDEECADGGDLLSQFDELTDSQMKEMEVKKLEDEITIKRLEKVYEDKTAGLAYSMKKLNEFRRKRRNAADLMKERVLVIRQALIEKSNELKGYNETLLVDMDNDVKKSVIHKKKIHELAMTFQAVTARDNDTKSSNKKLECKVNEVNSNIARQIGQRDEENKKLRETLTKTSSTIEALKKELRQNTINSNLKDSIEKTATRIIELETEAGNLQKQLKQELDAVLQDKNKLIQEETNSEKSIQENDTLISTLQSEIEISEKNKSDLERNVGQSKSEKEELFKQVAQARENIELSKKALVERDAHIESELTKIKDEKQSSMNNFTIAEESMHTELDKLYNTLELHKSLSQKLENSQRSGWKLNEKKTQTKKMYSSSLIGLEDKLKKTKEDVKKHEEILLNFNKKKITSELKIKELEQKKMQVNKNLESSTKKDEEKEVDKEIEVPSKLNTPKNEVTVKKIQVLPRSSSLKSIYSFRLSDSDESEDEFKIKDEEPKNSRLENSSFTQKTSGFPSDGKDQSSSNTTFSLSQHELFNSLFQKPSQSPTIAKTEDSKDVFKLPQPMTQYKRKTPQPKKK